ENENVTGLGLAVKLPPVPLPIVKFTGILSVVPTEGVTITLPWQRPDVSPLEFPLTVIEALLPKLMVLVPLMFALNQLTPAQVNSDTPTLIVMSVLLFVEIPICVLWEAPRAALKGIGFCVEVSVLLPPLPEALKVIVMTASAAPLLSVACSVT